MIGPRTGPPNPKRGAAKCTRGEHGSWRTAWYSVLYSGPRGRFRYVRCAASFAQSEWNLQFNMVVSTPSLLRGVIALSSILLTTLSGVAIYKCVFAVLLLAKSFPLDGYVWVDILGMAGSGKPEKHVVNLKLGGECEVAVWVAAGCGIGAGVMGVVRALFEERQRWRGVGKVCCNRADAYDEC
jgi:hypothetical protein